MDDQKAMQVDDVMPQARRTHQRVVLHGVDHVNSSTISSVLGRLHPSFRRPLPTYRPTPSGHGIILTHPEANLLLDLDVPDDLFGSRTRFGVTPLSSSRSSLFVRNIPSDLTNDDLLVIIPGSFKVRRLRNSATKAFVDFTDDQSMALALRDGVTIKRTSLVFEVPNPSPCRVCLSRDHRRCEGRPVCYRCGSPDQLSRVCEQATCCLICGQEGDHTTLKCPDLRQWQDQRREQETKRLLNLVPTVAEALSGVQDKAPTLSRRQQEMMSKGLERGMKSYADVAASRLNTRRKRMKSRRKQKQQDRQVPINHPRISKQQDEPIQPPANSPRPVPEHPKKDQQDPFNLFGLFADFFDLSEFDSEVVNNVQSALLDSFKTAMTRWIEETNQALDEWRRDLRDQKEQDLTISADDAQRLRDGQWKITCACGDSFEYSEGHLHQTRCRLNRPEEKNADQHPEPVHPSGQPEEVTPRTPSRPKKRSRSHHPITPPPPAKASDSKSTPDKMTQLKLDNFRDRVKSDSRSTQPQPRPKNVKSSSESKSKSKSEASNSVRKSRSKGRAGRR